MDYWLIAVAALLSLCDGLMVYLIVHEYRGAKGRPYGPSGWFDGRRYRKNWPPLAVFFITLFYLLQLHDGTGRPGDVLLYLSFFLFGVLCLIAWLISGLRLSAEGGSSS